MSPADLPLPPHRYVPGRTARPDGSFFEAIGDLAAASLPTQAEHDRVFWLYGLRLLDEGFFWEAHEVLEPIWLGAAPNSRERYLVQGVIHLANALLKERMGRPRARVRLADLGRKAFTEAFPPGTGRVMGIDRQAAFQAVESVATGRPPIPFFDDDAI